MAGSHPKWCKAHPVCKLKLKSPYYRHIYHEIWRENFTSKELSYFSAIISNCMLPKD